MPIRIPTLQIRNFHDTICRAQFCLLRLEASSRIAFHPGVAEFFVMAYPGKFRFGTLNRSTIRDASWLEANFQSATGRMRAGVRDGYYLFQGDRVAGHHFGKVARESMYASDDVEAQRQRVIQYGFMGRAPDPSVLESARQVVVYFDDIVARRTGTPEAERFRREHDSRRSSGPPPPRPPPPPKGPNPYQVLGLSPAASDAEVKAAYKAGVRMNHPDKVSHLSEALQKFAQAQVVEIIQAYETLKKERGLD